MKHVKKNTHPSMTDEELLERVRALVKKPKRLLSAKEVQDRTGMNYVSIWAGMKAGTFPCAKEISPKKLGWLESEIDDWMDALPRRKFKGVDDET